MLTAEIHNDEIGIIWDEDFKSMHPKERRECLKNLILLLQEVYAVETRMRFEKFKPKNGNDVA